MSVKWIHIIPLACFDHFRCRDQKELLLQTDLYMFVLVNDAISC